MSWADTRDGGRHHGPFGLFRRITGLSWPDLPVPTRMRRVALVAPGDALRDVLVRVADAAAVELGPPAGDAAAAEGAPSDGEAARRLRGSGHSASGAALSATRPDLDALQRAAATTCWPAKPSWRPTRPARWRPGAWAGRTVRAVGRAPGCSPAGLISAGRCLRQDVMLRLRLATRSEGPAGQRPTALTTGGRGRRSWFTANMTAMRRTFRERRSQCKPERPESPAWWWGSAGRGRAGGRWPGRSGRPGGAGRACSWSMSTVPRSLATP